MAQLTMKISTDFQETGSALRTELLCFSKTAWVYTPRRIGNKRAQSRELEATSY